MATISKRLLCVILAVAALLLGSCKKGGDGADTTADTTGYTVNEKNPQGAEVSEREITSGDFIYTLYSDGFATLNQYLGESSSLTVPREIDGHTVSAVGTLAFSGNQVVEEISFENENVVLEPYALCGAKALKKATLPSGMTKVPEGCFADCSVLAEVKLPEAVDTYSDGAFYNCMALTSVPLENIKTIGSYALAYTAIREARPTDKLESIGESAFHGCSYLAAVSLPESVKVIPANLFTSCIALTDVSMGEGVTSVGEYAFYGCCSLKEISLPEGVVAIAPYTFGECYLLEKVELRGPVTEIGEAAFYNCAKIVGFGLPVSLEKIGSYAFAYCESVKELEIPAGVTEIGAYAFADCLSLEKINIPAGITALSEYVFAGCASVQSFDIPSSVTAIGPCAFYECKAVKELHVPAGVTNFGIAAFAGMESLVSLRYLGEAEDIPDYLFDGTENVVIRCKKGGKMAEYAKENDIKYTVE